MPCTNCLAQQSKAEAVIDACIGANGGLEYPEASFQYIYKRGVSSRYVNYKPTLPTWRSNPIITRIEAYKRLGGEFLYLEQDLITNTNTQFGLNRQHSWQVENDQLAFIDTSLLYHKLWEVEFDSSHWPVPLCFHRKYQGQHFQWLRTEQEGGLLYDVLALSNSQEEHWFSQKTHLLYKTNRNSGYIQFIYTDYRQVGKVWMAFEESSYRNGRLAHATNYDSIAFPTTLPDSLFHIPQQYSVDEHTIIR